MKRLWIALLSLVPLVVHAQAVRPGATLSRSLHHQGGQMRVQRHDRPGLVIRGDNLTLDFGGMTLEGDTPQTAPDARMGIGVTVQGRNITIRGLRVRGFKTGLLATNCTKLRVVDCDFSDNWKQRLYSTLESEDERDWMSYHQNEKGEWRSHCAGLMLEDCRDFEIREVRIRGGQNGLMLTRCRDGLVWNSDFSFLSGLGVGMYRSSGNRLMHNRIDWCVRGYSHGKWNRGQDSAGILLYEQSSRNTIAYNSITHGGDGFFLWAGQSTMDTGQGGCNDNLVVGNDFSHAPTNGIETTFSRNRFIANRVLECWHGVWGGYSYDTEFRANQIGLCADGMAIEHGQNNRIVGNDFFRNLTDLRIWQNPTQDPNWGYPKHRDTASHDLDIADNRFAETTGTVLRLKDAKGVRVMDNRMEHVATVLDATGNLDGLKFGHNAISAEAWGKGADAEPFTPDQPRLRPTMLPSGNVILGTDTGLADYLKRFASPWPLPEARKLVAPLPGARSAYLPAGAVRGRRYILVDEWGPYDFRRPILWPRENPNLPAGVKSFEILGPKGQWKVVHTSGGEPSRSGGTVPDTIQVTTLPGLPLHLDLEFVGAEGWDVRGHRLPAGRPVRFGFHDDTVPLEWRIEWFGYKSQTEDPRMSAATVDQILARGAMATKTMSNLSIGTSASPNAGVPADHFLTRAVSTCNVPAAGYELEVTSDDGCRVWIDDQLVIDAWKYQGPTAYRARIAKGTHRLRILHFELDGYTALKARLVKGR